ncbi:MAG: hypothetical protein AAFW75_30530, partial [Cyanobacteria bacterium J06636_16]
QWEASLLSHLEGNDRDREWIVIDEAICILQSLKTKGHKQNAERLRGFIVEMVTAGAAVNDFVGILSHTGNAGPLGIDEDLLKNFSVVGCGKRKKAQMIKAFCKLTDLKLTAEQEAEILSLEDYWQLWENNGPCLSQVPLSQLVLKDVLPCPTNDQQRATAEDPTAAIALIREVLSKAESPLRASEIKQKKRSLKDSLTLQNVEEILAAMVTQGIVTMTAETPPRYALSRNVS